MTPPSCPAGWALSLDGLRSSRGQAWESRTRDSHEIFEGVASRDNFSMVNRHTQAPFDEARLAYRLHVGEWFEIAEADHDRMLDIPPPLSPVWRPPVTDGILHRRMACDWCSLGLANAPQGSRASFVLSFDVPADKREVA
ncbi:DUF1419 domain-containing protein [Rhizobium vallis]|uniref:DUF1419 domain-containing protein n=1 Tax=Rhizobium vallis TaxID=634290 RepID=A0A432PCN1_9HYPH|nr:DUF1419 domain-containing protein [Rhizobium vallis]RUM20660.1 DUF1419 domain-containing protein [Rhizobium vallis]